MFQQNSLVALLNTNIYFVRALQLYLFSQILESKLTQFMIFIDQGKIHNLLMHLTNPAFERIKRNLYYY